MGSRRGFLMRLDKELKARANNLPDGEALYQILIDLASPHPHPATADRTAAISGVAFIDHAIQRAIVTHLRIGADDKDTKSLFDGDRAPLGSLSARIMTARALGVIGPQTTEDLHTLRTIRNTFAHAILHIQFADKEVSDLCLSLNHLRQTLPDGQTLLEAFKAAGEPYERQAFILTVSHYFLELMSYEPEIPEHMRPAHEPSRPSSDKSK
jgi:DNA-binding MltR family transcriptional regulator